MFRRCVFRGDDIVLLKLLPRQCGRLQREWLRRRSLFAGHIALRNRRSSTPKTGLPVTRSSMNIQPDLPTCASAGIFLPSFVISTKPGRGRQILIP